MKPKVALAYAYLYADISGSRSKGGASKQTCVKTMAAWKKRKWDGVNSEDYQKEVPKKLRTKPESSKRTEIPLKRPSLQ